jgi:hypothetical protein
MPNWCDNELVIQTTLKGHPSERRLHKEELKRFVNYAKDKNVHDEDLVTDKFIPYPKRFYESDKKSAKHSEKIRKATEHITDPKERDKIVKKMGGWHLKDGFNDGGYDWCLRNWGTKWGICHSKLIDTNFDIGKALYRFDSAWSPPTPVIHKMSLMFPNLTFTLKYWECGCAFKGTYKAQNGNIIKDVSSHYTGGRGG